MTRVVSSRFGISYPDTVTRNEPADVPADLKILVDAFENLTPMYSQGTIASRPAASKVGRFYFATNEGILYLDNGTTWVAWGPPADSIGTAQLADNALSSTGAYASRPAANTVPAGYEYFATDTIASYRSTGAAWVRLDADLGKTAHFAVVPADGWQRADGTALTTANTKATDLRNALVATGSPYGASGVDPRAPNVQGRVLVGFNSADADFDTLGETRGTKTHVLTVDQMPAHNHDLTGVLYQPRVGGVLAGFSNDYIANPSYVAVDGWHGADPDAFGISTGPTPSTTTGDAHNNLQPSIVLHTYIKL